MICYGYWHHTADLLAEGTSLVKHQLTLLCQVTKCSLLVIPISPGETSRQTISAILLPCFASSLASLLYSLCFTPCPNGSKADARWGNVAEQCEINFFPCFLGGCYNSYSAGVVALTQEPGRLCPPFLRRNDSVCIVLFSCICIALCYTHPAK